MWVDAARGTIPRWVFDVASFLQSRFLTQPIPTSMRTRNIIRVSVTIRFTLRCDLTLRIEFVMRGLLQAKSVPNKLHTIRHIYYRLGRSLFWKFPKFGWRSRQIFLLCSKITFWFLKRFQPIPHRPWSLKHGIYVRNFPKSLYRLKIPVSKTVIRSSLVRRKADKISNIFNDKKKLFPTSKLNS